MHRTVRILLAFISILICMIPIDGQAKAKTITPSATKIVRVAFPIQGGLTQKDEYGNYTGYTYDYLQEIAQYTGWEYEFVEVPGDINQALLTLLDMLENGEIDIMGGMNKNEYTQDIFDFPEYAYGVSYFTLGVAEENSRITSDNYHGIQDLRIAIYKTSVVTKKKLENFCQLNNIEYSFVDCESEEEMLSAIKEGRADALLGSDLMPLSGIRTIAQFDGSQFYLAVTKGNTQLLNELNSTILTIQQVKPSFESVLYDKYFQQNPYHIYLSGEETEFIRTMEPIKIALIDKLEPIQFFDEEDNPGGISVDILNWIAQKTEIKFEYIPAADFESAFQLIEQGEADAICGIPYDYELAQTHGLIMSNSFLNAQMVLITKEGSTDISPNARVGIVERMQDISHSNLSDAITYRNIHECMKAVLAGEIDSAYMNLYSAEYLSHDFEYEGIRMVPQASETIDFCMGIKKPADTRLISILNKALISFAPKELETIIYQNTANGQRPITLGTFIEENPFFALGFLSILFLILAIIGLQTLRIRNRANKQLSVENQRYLRLSELANEYLYEYDCSRDLMTFSREFVKQFMVPESIQNFSEILSDVGDHKTFLNGEIVSLFRNLNQLEAQTVELDWLCPLPGGEQRWYRCTHARIRDANGRTVYALGKLTDVQNEKEEKNSLEQRALMDGLTGIYNAVASRKIIEERLKNLQRPGALLIIDIDCFKQFNDKLGHYIGDRVLQDFAELLVNKAEKWDIVGRLGGDEFVIYIDHAWDTAMVSDFCNGLCREARRTYTGEDGIAVMVSISVGVGIVQKSCTFNEIYQAVDKLLYESKENGRDRYTLAHYVPEAG